jgi:hypothetical protein
LGVREKEGEGEGEGERERERGREGERERGREGEEKEHTRKTETRTDALNNGFFIRYKNGRTKRQETTKPETYGQGRQQDS